MLVFHRLLFVLLLILCSIKKNLEIEVAAYHLVTAFRDGESSVCSCVITGKVSKPDQNHGSVPT